MASVSGKPFLIYVREMDHTLGALLSLHYEQGRKHAIYYLSCTMIRAKHRYNLVE